jgi:hypothetical protein
MLHPEEIKKKLQDRNLSAVARKTNISYYRLYNWYNSEDATEGPYYLIEALSQYLESEKD